mgnify:CR=1 FL=1
MARGSWDGWNLSWQTYVQGVALVAGEDLPNALRHALGAPQLGLFTRPLSCGKLRPRQHLLLLCRHHGSESRLSRALTPSRRRRRRAESLLASRFLTRRLAAAPHSACTISKFSKALTAVQRVWRRGGDARKGDSSFRQCSRFLQSARPNNVVRRAFTRWKSRPTDTRFVRQPRRLHLSITDSLSFSLNPHVR